MPREKNIVSHTYIARGCCKTRNDCNEMKNDQASSAAWSLNRRARRRLGNVRCVGPLARPPKPPTQESALRTMVQQTRQSISG